MALQAFLKQVLDQYFPEIPIWVNQELFFRAWSEELLEELLDQERDTEESEDFKFTLTDSLVVPFSVGEFDPSAKGGVNNQIDPILIPEEVRVELRTKLAESLAEQEEIERRRGELKYGHIDINRLVTGNQTGWWYQNQYDEGKLVFVTGVKNEIVNTRNTRFVCSVTKCVRSATAEEVAEEMQKYPVLEERLRKLRTTDSPFER